MGSGQGKARDQYRDKEETKRRKQREELIAEAIEKLEQIDCAGYYVPREFEEFEWLYKNRKKILRNRKLINIIDAGF